MKRGWLFLIPLIYITNEPLKQRIISFQLDLYSSKSIIIALVPTDIRLSKSFFA